MSVNTRLPAGAAVIASTALPFADFPLWMVAVVGLGLMLIGFAVTRKLKKDDA
jgi:hypothetical protein